MHTFSDLNLNSIFLVAGGFCSVRLSRRSCHCHVAILFVLQHDRLLLVEKKIIIIGGKCFVLCTNMIAVLFEYQRNLEK